MSELRASGLAAQGWTRGDPSYSTSGMSLDASAEVERLSHAVAILCTAVEELRVAYNAHVHVGAVPAPAPGERAGTAPVPP